MRRVPRLSVIGLPSRFPAAWTISVLAVLGSSAVAHSPTPGDEADSFLGCGKAEALARHFHPAGPIGVVQTVFAESFDDTDVLHNQLDIEITNIDPANDLCTITGSNRIRIRSQTEELTEFTFRLHDIFAVSSVIINDETSPVSVVVNNVSETTWVATLDRAYTLGEEFTLKIDYSGDTESFGFGSIDVGIQPGGAPIVASLSQPFYAYTWWPSKDSDVGIPGDNSDKATLEMSVTVPDTMDVPGNGLLESVDVLANNRLRYNWTTQYPIATYLVSFAAGEYNRWTDTYPHAGGNMPVEFYIYPDNDTPSNRDAWSLVVDMLGVFAPLFGEYPFVDEKYGIYNFPFGGGMEHQTMTGQGTFSENITAHEAAHQWWGDHVTCKTWRDIWLNEGFASYGECLWREFESGVSDHDAYLTRVLQRKPSSVADSVYVRDEVLTLVRIFSSTFTYNKGCWVLHQLRHVVGDETFFQILADYRSDFGGSAADTDDFANVASTTAGTDLTWFFDQWVYQPGAPHYLYAWNSVNVNGQEFIVIHLEQTQDATFPDVFIAPVDIEARINFNSLETVTVWQDQREQWFAVPVSGTVTSVRFDPEQWVLRTGAIEKAFTAVPGDFDGDGDVIEDDADAFMACFFAPAGNLEPECEPGDFDGNGTVDCDDLTQFGKVWMGDGDPPRDLSCLGAIPTVSTWGVVILILMILTGGTVAIRTTRAVLVVVVHD